MKRIIKWFKCIVWNGEHDYQHYHGGYAECVHCKAWKDTWL